MRDLLLALFFAVFLMIPAADAATINAASCSLADVQAAVDVAASGDTVNVPAGSASWASQLYITKAINLIGAGQGLTNITAGFSGDYLIEYHVADAAANLPFRVSGFTFDGGNISNHGIGLWNGDGSGIPATKIRVDHCTFKHYGPAGTVYMFFVDGPLYGVVDNCMFDIPESTTGHLIIFQLYGRASGELGTVAWSTRTFEFGSTDNLYFEDNIIKTGAMFTTGGGAGRYCFRHNTIDFTPSVLYGIYAWDMHGNGGTGGNLAGMGVEIYENDIVLPATSGGLDILDLRGGKALIHNNYITKTGGGGVGVTSRAREEFADGLNPPAENLISGQPQHVSDFYTWNTYVNGALYYSNSLPNVGVTIDYGGDEGIVPRENVHFWRHIAAFDGSAGIGSGPLSARPASCTKGVGYWASDTKTLYKCNETNTWIAYYTPYAYPHPIRTDCVNYPSMCDAGSSPSVIPGDVNGDGDVDIFDLDIVGIHFGQTNVHPEWNATADATASGEIDIYDIVFVASRFGG